MVDRWHDWYFHHAQIFRQALIPSPFSLTGGW